ncbi:MAG: TrkH family potassium uptake protein [Candidatus Hydrogenedentes bacterium]|nr:TrkH family potassium uptake protein [Candidatus Hydrogenedentota bacterium]
MNYCILSKYLGNICIAIGVSMTPAIAWAVYLGEANGLRSLALSLFASLAIGIALAWTGRGAPTRIYEREAIGLVGLTWIVACWLGSLPFVFAGTLGWNDAYFESVSGFTTTGSTVIIDVEAVEKSILFWRSLTHWLGGIGIVILFIAVLPYIGAGGKLIMKSESTGPSSSRLLPRFRKSAALMFKVYVSLTILNIAALMLAGMSFYDALIHTFGGLATGGFSNRQASVGAYHSLPIELVIMAFMVLGGTNFALFAEMWLGNWKALWQDTEWRLYMGILVMVTLLIAVNLMGMGGKFPDAGQSFEVVPEPQHYPAAHALRVSAFQVASCMTDTGFVTDDFDRWPFFSRIMLLLVMCIGGSAGSTSSGIKVVRLLMYAKIAVHRLEATFRPKTVKPLRIGGDVISETVQNRALSFLVVYVGWFVLGAVYLSWQGLPFDTAVSSMAACLNNCGPGLEHVGAIRDYHLVGPFGTAFLSLTMLLGRLELVTILVLFVPSFWRK